MIPQERVPLHILWQCSDCMPTANSFGLAHGKRVLVSFLFNLIWASTWQKGACVIFIGMIRFSSGYCAINPSLVSRKPKVKIPCQSRIMIFLLRHAHWKIFAQQLQKCQLRNATSHSLKRFSSTKHCRAETRAFLGCAPFQSDQKLRWHQIYQLTQK